MRKIAISLAAILLLLTGLFFIGTKINTNPARFVGEVIDSFNNVPVYYNGAVGHVSGRVLAKDGYNIGLRYQCVEFVKRYYYERFQHKMPQDRGNAKDFFNRSLKNGELNVERGLVQFTNGSGELPAVDDLVVFGPWILNRFGHVAIVSRVGPNDVEVIQQNPGPFGSSREKYKLVINGGKPRIDKSRLLGWLRRKKRT